VTEQWLTVDSATSAYEVGPDFAFTGVPLRYGRPVSPLRPVELARPKVDTVRYRLVPAQDGPHYLVVTDWTLRPMRQALESGQVDSQYRWPDSLAGFWYKYLVPTPEDFRFYAALLGRRSVCEVIDRQEPRPGCRSSSGRMA